LTYGNIPPGGTIILNYIYGAKMIEKAVLDRFEGTLAILLIGKKKRRVNVPMQLLPRQAKEGTWLKVEFDGSEIVKIEIDLEETERRRD